MKSAKKSGSGDQRNPVMRAADALGITTDAYCALVGKTYGELTSLAFHGKPLPSGREELVALIARHSQAIAALDEEVGLNICDALGASSDPADESVPVTALTRMEAGLRNVLTQLEGNK